MECPANSLIENTTTPPFLVLLDLPPFPARRYSRTASVPLEMMLPGTLEIGFSSTCVYVYVYDCVFRVARRREKAKTGKRTNKGGAAIKAMASSPLHDSAPSTIHHHPICTLSRSSFERRPREAGSSSMELCPTLRVSRLEQSPISSGRYSD